MDHNHHNKEDIKDIIDCVRLSEIYPSVLFALVEPSGFFDGQCILDALLRIQMKPELLEMRSCGRLGTREYGVGGVGFKGVVVCFV